MGILQLPPVTRINVDKYKAVVLIDTGLIHSGQRAGKDEHDTSCWISLNLLCNTYKCPLLKLQ